MKRKAFERQRERIVALADHWISQLGIGWWSVTHYYARSAKEYRECTGHDPVTSLMTCVTDWRYRTASITVNCPLTRDVTDNELEEFYIHELMHIFLSEMSVDAGDRQDHEERVATTLARAFLWVENRGA